MIIIIIIIIIITIIIIIIIIIIIVSCSDQALALWSTNTRWSKEFAKIPADIISDHNLLAQEPRPSYVPRPYGKQPKGLSRLMAVKHPLTRARLSASGDAESLRHWVP